MAEPLTRICADCGAPFDVAASEQEWFAAKGLHLPRRCTPCRHARKRTETRAHRGPALDAPRDWLTRDRTR